MYIMYNIDYIYVRSVEHIVQKVFGVPFDCEHLYEEQEALSL